MMAESGDRDGGRLGERVAVVAGPGAGDGAAFGGARRKRKVWIRRNRGVELGAEYLRAVVGADEVCDDVARDQCAELGAAKTALHVVRDQRLDLDDLAAAGACRHVDDRARHDHSSSRQAASVTTT